MDGAQNPLLDSNMVAHVLHHMRPKDLATTSPHAGLSVGEEEEESPFGNDGPRDRSALRTLFGWRTVSTAWKKAIDEKCAALWEWAVSEAFGQCPTVLLYNTAWVDVCKGIVRYRKDHELMLAKQAEDEYNRTACEYCPPATWDREFVKPPGGYAPVLSAAAQELIALSSKHLLRLLQACRYWQQDSSWAATALARYKMWLLLRRSHPGSYFIPTADIEFVWVSHILRTRSYHSDMGLLGISPAHSLILPSGLQPLYALALEKTSHAWKKLFPDSEYCQATMGQSKELDRLWANSEDQPSFFWEYGTAITADTSKMNDLNITLTPGDLVQDSKWLALFHSQFQDMCSDSHSWGVDYDDGAGMQLPRQLVKSYDRYLWIVSSYPKETHAPNVLIDLMWHAHQLDPLRYRECSTALFGFLLEHDMWPHGTDQAVSKRFDDLWMREFGVSHSEDHKYPKRRSEFDTIFLI